MRVVNVKELKARLSAYLRDVRRGDELLVTDRGEVVARLGPPERGPARVVGNDPLARLVAIGARPPLRARRPNDYRRTGAPTGLDTRQIDALLDDVRGER
jgi:prevent-host-death family protein